MTLASRPVPTLSVCAVMESNRLVGALRFVVWAMAAMALALAVVLARHAGISGFGLVLAFAGGLAWLGFAMPRPARGEPILDATADGLRLYPPHVRGVVPPGLVMWSDIAGIAAVHYRTTTCLVITFTPQGARRAGLRPASWGPSALLRWATTPKARCRATVLPMSVQDLVAQLQPVLALRGLALHRAPSMLDCHWHLTAAPDSLHQG